MKKILYTLAAVALTVLAAGCAKEMEKAVPAGDTVRATFTVNLPQSVVTKAISDGTNADELLFRAYDENGNLLSLLSKTVAVENYKATVEVDLVKELQYQFVFWAQAAGKYTIADDGTTITIASPAAMMNDGSYDAFYWREPTFTVTEAFVKDVTLTRPFAQLNVGAPDGDFTGAQASGIITDATGDQTLKTNVKLTVPNTINLLTGAVSGDAEVTFNNVTRPNEKLTVGTTQYDYVAMVYVLAPAERAANDTKEVTITLKTVQNAAGTTTAKEFTRVVPNVPLQRNYRTNILGRIFTVGGTFNITVDQDFAKDDDGNLLPDYLPEYTDIAALNTAFASDVATDYKWSYKVKVLAAGDTKEIVLPNTNNPVDLVFDGSSWADEEISINYSTATDALKPAKLSIEVAELKKLSGDLSSTTVTIVSGSTVDEGKLYTADNTLVIKPNAWFKKLTIKKGGVKVEKATEEGDNNGKISELTIDLAAGDSNVVDNDGTIEALVVSEGNVSVEGDATYESVTVEGGSATIEAAVTTVTVTDDGSATIEEGATVTTVVQEGDGEVTIAEGVTVSEIQAEDESKVTTAVTSEEALRAAIAANQGGTIVLGSDIVLTDGVENRLILPAGSDITIDLNGHSIKHDTRVFQVYNAKLTVVGPGSLEETLVDQYSPIMVFGSQDSSAEDFSVVNVSNLTLKGWSGIFVNPQNACAYGVKITATDVNIEGLDVTKGENALYINGQINKTDGNAPEITLNNVTANRGIYAAGYGKWTLNGCDITAEDFAMEIRAGELTIGSGEYKATAATFKSEANGNGSTTSGAALSVSQHSTNLPINVVINGGTFTGLKALYEADVQTAPSEGISLSVTGGTFNGEVYSQNCTDFITGGTFTDPNALNYGTANSDITVTMTANRVLNVPVWVRGTATLNFGEYTLTNDTDMWDTSSSPMAIANINVSGGNLTLNATNGGLDAKENDCYGIDVLENGKLTINGGSYTGNISVVQLERGDVTINGGTFRIKQLPNNVTDDKYRYTLNCIDARYKDGTAKFSVAGGSFYNFNPGNNQAEGANTNFLAAGYKVNEPVEGWYTVVPE